jgi:hypothetical protein
METLGVFLRLLPLTFVLYLLSSPTVHEAVRRAQHEANCHAESFLREFACSAYRGGF